MPRLNPIDPNQAEGKAKTLLDGVQKALGMTPNLMRTMAASPAVLGAYLGFIQALSGTSLSGKLREVIALTVAGANDCQYCIAAHTALGKMLGVDDAELTKNREGRSGDPKVEAALQFARAIVEERGWVSDEDVARVRDAGYSDGEIVEIVATVGLNIFSNYFDHVAQTDIDFPVVKAGEPAA
ncbi:MAG: carboxymuconolactone decarboxylase family protein [Alphaproteobacteria bacterium]